MGKLEKRLSMKMSQFFLLLIASVALLIVQHMRQSNCSRQQELLQALLLQP